MRSVKVFLALSVALNLALGAWLMLRPPTSSTLPSDKQEINFATPKSTPAIGNRASAKSPDESKIPWHSPRDAIAILRASGASVAMLRAVANILVSEKYQAELDAIMRPPGTPRWKKVYSRMTADQQERLKELSRNKNEEIDALVGSIADLSPIGFGGAPADKKRAADIVVHDYFEFNRKYGRPLSATERHFLDTEFKRDLTSVLTPAQMRDYYLFDSREAARLQQRLDGADLTDDEYTRVYDAAAAAWKDLENVSDGSRNFRAAEIHAVQNAVGSKPAALMALNSDRTFKEFGQLYVSAGFSDNELVARYFDWVQLFGGLDAIQSAGTQQQPGQLASLASTYYNKLTAGMNEQQRATFDRTQTGNFLKRSAGPSK